MLEASWVKHGAFVHAQIIWAKSRPVLTRTMYSWAHEPCFFGWLKGNKPARIPGEPVLSTLWQFDTIPNGAERPDHPTPKPLALFEIPMKQHTTSGGAPGMGSGSVCYEPFAGSGTQLIAAEKLGRRCLAIEISPVYCDLIVRRFMATFPACVPPEVRAKYARDQSGGAECAPPEAEPGAGAGVIPGAGAGAGA